MVRLDQGQVQALEAISDEVRAHSYPSWTSSYRCRYRRATAFSKNVLLRALTPTFIGQNPTLMISTAQFE